MSAFKYVDDGSARRWFGEWGQGWFELVRVKERSQAFRDLGGCGDRLSCERCWWGGEGLELEPSRTMYPDGSNSNAPLLLCRGCAEEHHEYWDSVWKDYYGGLL